MEKPNLKYTMPIDKLFRQFGTQPIELKFLCNTQKNNDSEHLKVPITINGCMFSAMINSRAQGNYISPRIVNENKEQLEWEYKEDPYRLSTVEGYEVTYKDGFVIRETVPFSVLILGKDENITFDIIDIADH